MNLSDRQRKILELLIEEYIESAEPVSSDVLKKKSRLSVSPATIRNDLQTLTEAGYVAQPHTSAGRVPTDKGYQYFVQITFTRQDPLPEFITREIEATREKIDRELQLVQELEKSLEHIYDALNFNRMEEKALLDILKVIGPRATYHKNIDTLRELLEKFNQS